MSHSTALSRRRRPFPPHCGKTRSPWRATRRQRPRHHVPHPRPPAEYSVRGGAPRRLGHPPRWSPLLRVADGGAVAHGTDGLRHPGDLERQPRARGRAAHRRHQGSGGPRCLNSWSTSAGRMVRERGDQRSEPGGPAPRRKPRSARTAAGSKKCLGHDGRLRMAVLRHQQERTASLVQHERLWDLAGEQQAQRRGKERLNRGRPAAVQGDPGPLVGPRMLGRAGGNLPGQAGVARASGELRAQWRFDRLQLISRITRSTF
ncbi:hypothetical protein SAMN05421835_113181 [Amycolatopsis sacchari]|uniref:Uncharacterized protein n=1 Tax=Amycolatopsis sacchari TaxID=115433 RepID=A0A1I3WQQ8_9PSEU|nr:hypothetical protein SAMN05421835_113181 [Amycolatopsis sacchari]